ncbi:MAG: 1-hydroxycarotenoid 3,4-desaturase CrtD [Pseudomonadota bacterium]
MADRDRVVVIGAGIGGLVCAVDLARQGVPVTVLEKAPEPGGKMRQIAIGETHLDGGPTVFTMRSLFDRLFEDAGARFDDHVKTRRLEVLARHAWRDDARLDLFADVNRSADAIGDFAGAAEAAGYRAFCERTHRIFSALDDTFIRATKPNMLQLTGRVLPKGVGALLALRPFGTFWSGLTKHFSDPRLRQLFGRYATYVGSSPFRTPATLMLVAHVEQAGVWSVDGGMHCLARALADLAGSLGATFRYDTHVARIVVDGGRAAGVELASGEILDAAAVVANGDVGSFGRGAFGPAVRDAAPAVPARARSLSAATWAMTATTDGFPLVRHNVFFGADYAEEFDAVFAADRLPLEPTVYVCAQDRDDREDPGPTGPERLLCLVNAPPSGDRRAFTTAEIDACAERTFNHMERLGLRIGRRPERTVVTTPADFERLFPATGGALYGRASHGWRASFQRPGSVSRVPGLFLAGGSTHPGPGVPMAAVSGRLAAASTIADLASTHRWTPRAIAGGTSTPSATTAVPASPSSR